MRELYIIGGLALGAASVFGTMSVVNYSHSPSVQIPNNLVYEEKFIPKEAETANYEPQDSEPIYEKNAFDINRGEEVAQVTTPTPVEPPQTPAGDFQFELQGIHILGEKKMALISAQPLRKSRSGKTSPVKSTSSVEAKLVSLGQDLEGTGMKVSAIEPGKVTLEDSSGLTRELAFSLASDESLKRAEVAYKNELGRQKQFAKQNQFKDSPKGQLAGSKPQAPSNSQQQKIAAIQSKYGNYKKKVQEAYKSGRMSKEHYQNAMKRIGEGYKKEVERANSSK